jgi:hypothetical protein
MKPLAPSQFQAANALRKRLGKRLPENTTIVSKINRTINVPSADPSQPQVEVKLPARRKLNSLMVTTQQQQQKATTTARKGSPTRSLTDGGEMQRLEVALTRDTRDGTLGIDMDQFMGKPTVAVVVAGGPADHDGSVCAGDVITAVEDVECDSMAKVIAVLKSPEVAAKNPVTMHLLRRATYTVVEENLLMRALPLSAAADGVAHVVAGASLEGGTGANDELDTLPEWKECRCALLSDRNLVIEAASMSIQVTVSLRSMQGVQLIITSDVGPNAPPGSIPDRSCLQVRTADGLIELCLPSGSKAARLVAWQRPLEEMLMESISAVHQGWMYNFSSPTKNLESITKDTIPRIFLDLNTNLSNFKTYRACSSSICRGTWAIKRLLQPSR